MDQLEKFITDNIEQFNDGQMPAADKELFNKKLKESELQKVSKIGFARIIRMTSVAVAAIVLVFIVKNVTITKEAKTIDVVNYTQQLAKEGDEILNLYKEMAPEALEELKSTLNIVLHESIPLNEQLPDELSADKKALILREYYKQKSEALKSLKLLYAQETNPID
ncbi:MAG: hypothetical protein Q4B21_01210 [Bacteroidia bacterium]|nr:hypothetical protein [Bacteroidia bacterium]